ncbi:hypothetical protein SERLADRAFT_440164 [Serpula lacrymans var. lacrymans S7.9]|uniref:Uncharacterized protein n=1 Tax=Serpula lacrymans var. lacrymans (strain S7.9) TaxID=578457 RepID=F8P3P7_SERL9|nr:uncharacterized protein SERLADRAFT_440164 [Serpula lacrymans var. lacrymans S7.9]EGO22146.1 hypothetical protein SERLADRAFT_440164 [Serpula lacrymans var. lacrymans S7.9]
MVAEYEMYTDDLASMPPPGNEAIDISHEGGEHKAYDDLAKQIAELSEYSYVDPRTRNDRLEVQNKNWEAQFDRLTSAYLDYYSHCSDSSLPAISVYAPDLSEGKDCPSLQNIELVDLFSRRQESLKPNPSHKYPNETLIFYV